MAVQSYSLRRRLLLLLFLPLLVIGVLALMDTWREAVLTADAVSDRVLAGSALAIAERVVVDEDGSLQVDIPYVALEMLTSAAQDRVFYRVDSPPGTFITGYADLPAADAEEEEVAFSDERFRGEPIRLAVLERAASSGVSAIPFTVTVAETTIARLQLAQTLLFRSALRLGLVLAAAAFVIWFAVSASLAPLARLRQAIAQRSSGDLHPISETIPREVEGLVATINDFMTRLEAALGALQHFTGNASHQLRTPLTIVRTQLELAQRAESPQEARAALAAADEAVVHAERILSQLLLLARIDEAASDRLAGLDVDLSVLARTQSAENVLRARAMGVDLGFDGEEGIIVRGDAMLLGELLHNLIDNAITYAGQGAEATVRIRRKGNRAILEVEDNGTGIPEDKLADVRRRFVRAEAGKPGAGLGLPVVEEIAALFGGNFSLSAPSGGQGLIARVDFPLVRVAPALSPSDDALMSRRYAAAK
jgi:two-component system, OmpR family, sensor histidine kinase TctE